MTHEFWYLSRAAGFTAYLLLAASVALGLGVQTRALDRVARRFASFDLHRFTALLAIAFTLLHVYVLLGDRYYEWSIAALSLPFRSPYRPLAVTTGVLALYGTGVVAASFALRRHIGFRGWRALHYSTFAIYAAATAHGLLAGTDSGEPWAFALYVAGAVPIAPLLGYRALRAWRRPAVRKGRRHAGAAGATGATGARAAEGR